LRPRRRSRRRAPGGAAAPRRDRRAGGAANEPRLGHRHHRPRGRRRRDRRHRPRRRGPARAAPPRRPRRARGGAAHRARLAAAPRRHPHHRRGRLALAPDSTMTRRTAYALIIAALFLAAFYGFVALNDLAELPLRTYSRDWFDRIPHREGLLFQALVFFAAPAA